MSSRAYRYHLGSRSWQSAFRKKTTHLPIVQSSNKVCVCSIDCPRCIKAVFVQGSSTHQAIARTQFALKRTGQCMDEVKPCETWMYFAHEVKLVTCGILAKSVSSGCASALQAQHPHMVPRQLELPLHCVVLATTRTYLKCSMDLGCNRVVST